jgi:hypothetical protein
LLCAVPVSPNLTAIWMLLSGLQSMPLDLLAAFPQPLPHATQRPTPTAKAMLRLWQVRLIVIARQEPAFCLVKRAFLI